MPVESKLLAQIMLVGLFVLLLVGGAAVVYTFAEMKTDRRGVDLTLQRYDGIIGRILDQNERSTEIEDVRLWDWRDNGSTR